MVCQKEIVQQIFNDMEGFDTDEKRMHWLDKETMVNDIECSMGRLFIKSAVKQEVINTPSQHQHFNSAFHTVPNSMQTSTPNSLGRRFKREPCVFVHIVQKKHFTQNRVWYQNLFHILSTNMTCRYTEIYS